MAEALHILPLSRLPNETWFLNPLASRNIDVLQPPPQSDLVTQVLRTCPDAACTWLSSLCPPTPHPNPHRHHHHHHHHHAGKKPWEASSERVDRLMRSMLVTAFIIEHAGTIGNTTGTRKDPATETVPARVSRKRNSSVNEADDDEEDRDPDDDGDRARSSKRARAEDSSPGQQASFACPFFKMNSIRHQACLFYKMSKISYVKQHLQRTHRGPRWRCSVCQEAFPDQAAYNRHLTAQECQGPKSKVRQDEMSEGQWEEIGRLTSRRAGATTESMWYAMFDVLFPGAPRPETPYVESGISEMTRHFRDFVKEKGPAIIRSHLDTAGTWQGLEDSGIKPDMLLQFVMSSGIDLVFENWVKSGDAGSPGPAVADRGSTPRNVFRGEPTAEGSAYQFPPRSQPAATSAAFLPPLTTLYDARTPPSTSEPIASPTMYHGRAHSSVSAPETPSLSEMSTETAPLTAIHRGQGPRSSGSGSVDVAAENVSATPSRGRRDMSISALTEETATALLDLFKSPQS